MERSGADWVGGGRDAARVLWDGGKPSPGLGGAEAMACALALGDLAVEAVLGDEASVRAMRGPAKPVGSTQAERFDRSEALSSVRGSVPAEIGGEALLRLGRAHRALREALPFAAGSKASTLLADWVWRRCALELCAAAGADVAKTDAALLDDAAEGRIRAALVPGVEEMEVKKTLARALLSGWQKEDPNGPSGSDAFQSRWDVTEGLSGTYRSKRLLSVEEARACGASEERIESARASAREFVARSPASAEIAGLSMDSFVGTDGGTSALTLRDVGGNPWTAWTNGGVEVPACAEKPPGSGDAPSRRGPSA